MAKLTAAARRAIPSSAFVFPKSRKFPIEDASHARNALSRAAAKGGSVEAKVRAQVKAEYPGIGNSKPTHAPYHETHRYDWRSRNNLKRGRSD